jgi:hypothetical protein
MDLKNYVKANEIPFQQLAVLGIEKDAVLDLPKNALDRILTGRTSPLLKMQYRDAKGETHSFAAKFSLTRDEKNEVQLTLYPRWKEIRDDLHLGKEDLRRLENGEILLRKVDRGHVEEEMYLQIDKETNTIMQARQREIAIPDAIGDVVCGEEMKQRMRDGLPVEVEVGDTKVTVGVDLNDPTGFRVLKGDLNEWQQKKLVEWDRITPGATGYWQTSENGWEYMKTLQEDQKITTGLSR